MEKVYTINNLECAHCGSKIEELIGGMQGIESAVLNFPLKKLTVNGEIDEDTLECMNDLARAVEAGVEIVPFIELAVAEAKSETDCTDCKDGEDDEKEEMKKELISVGAGILLLALAVILKKFTPVSIVLYAVSYLTLGFKVLKNTVANLRHGNLFDENFLMTVATIGAFILGEYSEAVGVMLFFKIGELFEDYAVSKSRKAITAVAGLKVNEADVLVNGEFVRTPSESIKAGDIIRVKNGERIAVDGIIESGTSKIDTSAVNGEPVPLTVKTGDSVMSGCINLADTFTLRAVSSASDSMISKIAKAVEDASASKPKADRFITRFAKVYTPFVIVCAVLTAIVPSLITGNWGKWIYSALTFLVISCPCALVLSVPLAYFSGIGAGSKLGILFKGGSSIEAIGKVKSVAFDKTGTLTDGTFTVTDIKSYGKLSPEQLMAICGSCEQSSSHPVAESIVRYCKDSGIKIQSAENASEIAGQGISTVMNGKKVLCGNERLMKSDGIEVAESESLSGSIVYVAVDGRIEGRIVVSDTVKQTSAKAVSYLRKMGIYTAMLTGDKTENAETVGRQLGIDYVKGGLLPDGKLSEIKKIKEVSGEVMFIGDGINDGPVLAGADAGGAMHSGADLALQTADVIFMNTEPETVVKAKKISDTTMKIAYQNIVFALAVKALVLIMGLSGHPNMWLAVFADSGTAMICILNSVRILNTKKFSLGK